MSAIERIHWETLIDLNIFCISLNRVLSFPFFILKLAFRNLNLSKAVF